MTLISKNQTTNEDLKKVYQNIENWHDKVGACSARPRQRTAQTDHVGTCALRWVPDTTQGKMKNIRAFLCERRRNSKVIASDDLEDLRLQPAEAAGAQGGHRGGMLPRNSALEGV